MLVWCSPLETPAVLSRRVRGVCYSFSAEKPPVEWKGRSPFLLPGVNSVLFCIMGIDNAAVLSRRVRADSLLKQAPGRAFRRGLVEGRRLSPDLSRGRCRRVSPVRLFGSIVPTGKPAMFETAHLKGQRVIVYYALISGAFVAEPVRRDCPPIS